MSAANWFDIIVISLALILGVVNAFKGLVKTAFGLIGLIGGLIIATRFSNVAENFIREYIYNFENSSMLELISIISLWIAFWLVCILIGQFISKLFYVSGLGFLDILGGFIVGASKFLLILAAVVAVASTTYLDDVIKPYVKDSKIYPELVVTGKWLTNIDVNALKNDIDEMIIKPAQSKSDKAIKDKNITINFTTLDKDATKGEIK